MRHEQVRESSRGRKAVRASSVGSSKKTRRKSASAKKAVGGSKVRSVRKKAAASKTAKPKSAAKTRTRRAGASKNIGGTAKRKSASSKATPRARNEATIDEMSFARGSEERYSRATAQPKMRLPRKGLQKGISNLSARAEKDILPSNSINPALRRR
ncbi:hypothetical protein [Bdellovibrio bacteriovorus]|uniref:hypothetical protein n=1 Tax=Bdellovibrio bacteriovorus TaxID=959 RepID=UPI003AA9D1AE